MFFDITVANADLIAQVLCLTQHVTHLIETDKKGMGEDKGWTCDLTPQRRSLLCGGADDCRPSQTPSSKVSRPKVAELEDEHGGEEGVFAELEKANKARHIRRSSSRSVC
jgi:hypothetical protein